MEESDEGSLSSEETLETREPLSVESSRGNITLPSASHGRRTTGPTRRSTNGLWTEEADKKLARAVEKHGAKNWKAIANEIPGSSDSQCLHRWQKVVDPTIIKGPWTKEEDNLLISLVSRHGQSIKSWSVIAKDMSGRGGKQCRERWINHLRPGIKTDPWTREEELTLIRAQEKHGNKWAEIAKSLPGRTENSIKNLWNSFIRKSCRSPREEENCVTNRSSEITCDANDISESASTSKSDGCATSDLQEADAGGRVEPNHPLDEASPSSPESPSRPWKSSLGYIHLNSFMPGRVPTICRFIRNRAISGFRRTPPANNDASPPDITKSLSGLRTIGSRFKKPSIIRGPRT